MPPTTAKICDTVAAHYFKIPTVTIRKWLQRGQITHHGHDWQGRALVDPYEVCARIGDKAPA